MPDEIKLIESPIHKLCAEAGAKFTDLAGWEMPESFSGAFEEVAQARKRAAVFDVTHIGRIHVKGDEAFDLLERACTADVAHQEDDTALFTLMCNESGGILVDAFIFRLADYWLITVEPACREKVIKHLTSLSDGMDVKITDQTEKTAMVAVCGPKAGELLDAILPFSVSQLPKRAIKAGSMMIAKYIAARISITGQWGIEVAFPNMLAGQAWRFITSKAGDNAIAPAGLAARDIMRIESGICRYGYELNETIDPFMAGLGDAVDFSCDFLGSNALAEIMTTGPKRNRVGLLFDTADESLSHFIPAQGDAVTDTDGQDVGAITSATFSPTLEAVIAQAYIRPDVAAVGTDLKVFSGFDPLAAKVVEMPFVKVD